MTEGRRSEREGRERKEWLRVTQTERDRDGEKQMSVRKKEERERERVSLRKQTLRQHCMTCTFSPLDNPEVGCVVTGGGGIRGRGRQTDRQTVRGEPEKAKSQWKERNEKEVCDERRQEEKI